METNEERANNLQPREETKKKAVSNVVLNILEVWPRSDVPVLFAAFTFGLWKGGAWGTRKREGYGAEHLVTATFVQRRNWRAKNFIYLF